MKSTLIWIILGGTILLFGGSVDAWSRQFFSRYSRNNMFHNGDLGSFSAAAVNNANKNNNGIVDYHGFLGSVGRVGNIGVAGAAADGITSGQQQQNEVYGIVEPLIEDMPCVDRPCNSNDECCPTGVCVNTYGEGKCIYVYGRKRDLCHRNTDCDAGMACLKAPSGNLICQPAPAGTLTLPVGKQFGQECATSSDCNVTKGLCCQLQRSHHRRMPKKVCSYFRDPFVCIYMLPLGEDEEIREPRRMSSFSQKFI